MTAGDDLENLTNVLGEGAAKLQGECNHLHLSSILHAAADIMSTPKVLSEAI